MTHDRRDLEALFAPPDKLFGTHMLLCGLSADTETLERLVATFTGENPVERAANGLVRSILMLDASAPRLRPLAVPGMLQLEHCELPHWAEQTSLMHAKVALLGFADAKFAAPTSFRLLVSTGNWTRETWGNGKQIDMFWSTEHAIDDVSAPGDNRADMTAALAFFERLMQTLYPYSTAALSNQSLATGWLDDWKRLLARRRGDESPRFVHSLDASLFSQIRKVFPDNGASSLIIGSGFWEQSANSAGDKPEVLAKLDELAVRGERYLVLNTGQAGALAPWLAAHPKRWASGKIDGWTLCSPADPLATKQGSGRTFLHAKYIAGLTRVSHDAKGTMTFLYLGSGNLSRAGLLSKAAIGRKGPARQQAGNVEAGVVLVDRQEVPQVWRALACGDILAPAEIKALQAGGGEPVLVPRAPSPVVLARVEKGRLLLVRGTDEPTALEVQLDAMDAWIAVSADAAYLPLPAVTLPPIIRVRLPAGSGAASEIHEVAVLGEDGTWCRQAPNEVSIDSALEALLAFPAAPPYLPDPDSPQPVIRRATASTLAARYPLKLLATLIEAIGHRNCMLTKEQFPVWLSQLRFLLLEQVSLMDRAAIIKADVNLFPALLQPGFVPAWLELDTLLGVAYQNLIHDIAQTWSSPSAEACPAPLTHPGWKGIPDEAAA